MSNLKIAKSFIAISLILAACSTPTSSEQQNVSDANPELTHITKISYERLVELGICAPDMGVPITKLVHGSFSNPGNILGEPAVLIAEEHSTSERTATDTIVHELTHLCSTEVTYQEVFDFIMLQYYGEKGYLLLGTNGVEDTHFSSINEGYATFITLLLSEQPDETELFYQTINNGAYLRNMQYYLFLADKAGIDPTENIGFRALLERASGLILDNQRLSIFMDLMQRLELGRVSLQSAEEEFDQIFWNPYTTN